MTTTAAGRRYSRRRVTATVTEAGTVYTESIDWASSFGPKVLDRLQASALAVLDAAQIPAAEILEEHGERELVRCVLYGRLAGVIWSGPGREPDSPEGIAARVIELCVRLRELPKRDAPAHVLMGDAFRLGRLTALDAVYCLDDEARATGRTNRSAGAAAESDRRRRQWLRLRAEVARTRECADWPPRRWNAEADRRLADWLTRRGSPIKAATIRNQRTRERWHGAE